jgi:hypothetical protein
MKRSEILEKADALICGDRDRTHGDAFKQLSYVGRMWSNYLGVAVRAEQVAMCMVMMKLSRSKCGEYNPDDYIDLIGYAALAGELRAREEEPPTTKEAG